MALANYTDLLASINGSGAWLHRTDLAAIIPDWVTLCETTINKGDLETFGVEGLRTSDQEATAALVTVANFQTVALPAAYLETRKIYITVGGNRIELIEAPTLPMRADERSNTPGQPSTYIISGSNLVLFPIPDQAYPITLLYYALVGPLSTQGTNWLMTAAPMVYLAGSIAHGAPWLGPTFNATPWIAGFRTGMSQVLRSDVKKRSRLVELRSEVAGITRASTFNIMTGT